MSSDCLRLSDYIKQYENTEKKLSLISREHTKFVMELKSNIKTYINDLNEFNEKYRKKSHVTVYKYNKIVEQYNQRIKEMQKNINNSIEIYNIQIKEASQDQEILFYNIYRLHDKLTLQQKSCADLKHHSEIKNRINEKRKRTTSNINKK